MEEESIMNTENSLELIPGSTHNRQYANLDEFEILSTNSLSHEN
jgi:hypothetical protein